MTFVSVQTNTSSTRRGSLVFRSRLFYVLVFYLALLAKTYTATAERMFRRKSAMLSAGPPGSAAAAGQDEHVVQFDPQGDPLRYAAKEGDVAKVTTLLVSLPPSAINSMNRVHFFSHYLSLSLSLSSFSLFFFYTINVRLTTRPHDVRCL